MDKHSFFALFGHLNAGAQIRNIRRKLGFKRPFFYELTGKTTEGVEKQDTNLKPLLDKVEAAIQELDDYILTKAELPRSLRD